jgi:hypothetical protein
MAHTKEDKKAALLTLRKMLRKRFQVLESQKPKDAPETPKPEALTAKAGAKE